MSDVSWHTKSGEEVLSELDTPLGGLTSQEAENRLEKYGENKLREPDKCRLSYGFVSIPRSSQLFANRCRFACTSNTSR